MSNNLDIWYQNKLKELLNAPLKSDRTGTGTYSSFGHFFEYNMKDGFPLLTTKKLSFKNIAYELFWFLKGDTNIKYLVDNGVNIWNGDAYKAYLKNFNISSNPISFKNNNPEEGPCDQEEWLIKMKTNDWFASFHGNLGKIYGSQWTAWERYGYRNVEVPSISADIRDKWLEEMNINQITNLINTLKTNPDDRRMLVSAWNLAELDKMVLPPCHYAFQVYTRELTLEERRYIYGLNCPEWATSEFFDFFNIPKRSISLMWHQRSADFYLGVPYNIASYALLLTMLGHMVNMVPEHLKGTFGDFHLYTNHVEQAKLQCEREPKELPTLKIISEEVKSNITDYSFSDFSLMNYDPHPAISAPLSN